VTGRPRGTRRETGPEKGTQASLVSGHPADAPLSTADRTAAGVSRRYTAWCSRPRSSAALLDGALRFRGFLFSGGGVLLLVVSARVARFLRRLLIAFARPVVGGVEPVTAEMHRDGIQHSLDPQCSAQGTCIWRRAGDPLEDLEDVPVPALV